MTDDASALPLDVDAIMAEIDRRIVAENRLPAAGWRVLAITRDVLARLSESGSPTPPPGEER